MNSGIPKNQFYQSLTECLEGKHACLRHKNILLRLSAQEVLLIEWALEAYVKTPVIEALNDSASELNLGELTVGGVNGAISEIESAYRKTEERRPVIKGLLSKLFDALDVAAEHEQTRSGLDFGDGEKRN